MSSVALPPEEDALREELLQLCKVAATLTPEQEGRLPRLLEALFSHLKDKALGLVHAAGTKPVLFGYSCDGTPIRAAVTLCQSSKRGTTVRKGRVLHEFLLQRGFVRTRDAWTAQEELQVLFSNILVCSQGKKAPNLFAAACRFSLYSETWGTGESASRGSVPTEASCPASANYSSNARRASTNQGWGLTWGQMPWSWNARTGLWPQAVCATTCRMPCIGLWHPMQPWQTSRASISLWRV